MKIKEVSYRMLRVTRQFENDTVAVTLELTEDQNVAEAKRAMELAQQLCDEALLAGRTASLGDKVKHAMATPEGRAALERALGGYTGYK